MHEADRRRYGGRPDAYARPRVRITSHKDRLRADVVRVGDARVSAMHLLQTDRDVAPAMGRVHLVNPAAGFSKDHFMQDIDGDINEGQRIMVEKSRKGPFRAHAGSRSTVMDSSAHVVYRNRSGIMEITVRRGIIDSEIQLLLNKLQTHRMSTFGSYVVLIKGNRRVPVGKLESISLSQLRDMVLDCIDQYGVCGLEITEGGHKPGQGALYRSSVHKGRYKSRARRGQGMLYD